MTHVPALKRTSATLLYVGQQPKPHLHLLTPASRRVCLQLASPRGCIIVCKLSRRQAFPSSASQNVKR